jgi:Bacteriocin-protection, YdeI or OmpD-Associated
MPMTRTQFPNKAPQPVPGNVKGALAKRKLTEVFQDRPDYQQAEYLKWIALANGPAAKQARLDQMLEELEKGGLFKGEPWTPPAKSEPAKK